MKRMKHKRVPRKHKGTSRRGGRGGALIIYYSGANTRMDPWSSLTPVGQLWMAAYLRQEGFRYRLLNLSGNDMPNAKSKLREAVKRFSPDLIGATMYTFNRTETLQALSYCASIRPEASIIAGGPHAVARADALLEQCRYLRGVAQGDGEGIMSTLLKEPYDDPPGLITRKNRDKSPYFFPDLNSLPNPATSGSEDYSLRFVTSSRGCAYSCHYCSSDMQWGKGGLRQRSVRNVGQEARALTRKGIWSINFRDEGFAAPKSRVLDICRELEGSGIIWQCQSRPEHIDDEVALAMARAGCVCIQIGLEAASDRDREYLGRKGEIEAVIKASESCRNSGIILSAYMISGIPGSRDSDLQASVDLIKKSELWDGVVSPLSVYPGTELFFRLVKEGQIKEDIFESKPALRNLFALNLKEGLAQSRMISAAFDSQRPSKEKELSMVLKAEELNGFTPVTFIRKTMLKLKMKKLDEAITIVRETEDKWHSPHVPLLLRVIGKKTGRKELVNQARGWLGKFQGFREDRLWPAGEI